MELSLRLGLPVRACPTTTSIPTLPCSRRVSIRSKHMRNSPSAAILLLTSGTVLAASLSPVRAEGPPLRERIDAEIRASWQKEEIAPASPADDAEFLRRIYLDLLGTIPTAEEAAAFLKDSEADKRARLIDKLLDDPRHVDQQTTTWD